MATGTAVLDFGEGAFDTSVAVPDTTVTGTTKVEAYILVPNSDTGRPRDEYWVEDLEVFAGNVSAGVGFTVYGKAMCSRAFGQFTINWASL